MKAKKLEKFIYSLEDVLIETENELENSNSPWKHDILEDIVKVEIVELLEYARNGKVFFRYGKRQRRLHSTGIKLEWIHEHLDATPLGLKISALQDIYDKI